VENDKVRVVNFFSQDACVLWLPFPGVPKKKKTNRTISWDDLNELSSFDIYAVEVEPTVIITDELLRKLLPLMHSSKVVLSYNEETAMALKAIEQENIQAQVCPLNQCSRMGEAISHCIAALSDRHPSIDWSKNSGKGIVLSPALTPNWRELEEFQQIQPDSELLQPDSAPRKKKRNSRSSTAPESSTSHLTSPLGSSTSADSSPLSIPPLGSSTSPDSSPVCVLRPSSAPDSFPVSARRTRRFEDQDFKQTSRISVPRTSPTNDLPKALVLGMVLTEEYERSDPMDKSTGQWFRDGIRLDELSKSYNIHTLDDKHSTCLYIYDLLSFIEPFLVSSRIPHFHVSAGIINSFLGILLTFHGENYFEAYDHIMLDYHFAPGSEYQVTWQSFMEKTLPIIATTNLLSKDGIVWLPGWDLTDNACKDSKITHLYSVEKIMDPREHPLFVATEAVKETLIAACGVNISFCEKGSLSHSPSQYFIHSPSLSRLLLQANTSGR